MENTLSPQQASDVAAMVRRARKAKGLTGMQVAEAAGVAPGTVVSIENARAVRSGNLRAVLGALGLPLLSDVPQTVDARVELALDLVRKWLQAMPDDQVDEAVRELTRFTVLR